MLNLVLVLCPNIYTQSITHVGINGKTFFFVELLNFFMEHLKSRCPFLSMCLLRLRHDQTLLLYFSLISIGSELFNNIILLASLAYWEFLRLNILRNTYFVINVEAILSFINYGLRIILMSL